MQTLNSPGETSSAPERPEAVAALAAEAVAGDGLGPTAPPAPALPGVAAGGAQSVARNTLIMLAQQMVTFAMTFVWTVAVQWYLGPDHYGQLFYAQSLAWIGAVFIDAGVTTYLTKQVARDRAHTERLLSNALVLRTASGALVYAAILGVAWGMGKHDDVFLAVALVALGIVAASFTQAAAATFQGHETMLWPALGTIAEKVAVALLSVTLLLLGYGLLAVAAVLFCGAAINLLIVGTRALRTGWVHPQIDPTVMRALLIGGAPFFLWAAFGVIYQRNAAIQLEAQDPSSEGVFGVAVRMYETLSFVPYIFQVAILPVLARTFVQAQDSMTQTARRSVDLITLAALPMGTAVLLLAPEIVALVARLPDYDGAVLPLRILAVSLVPLYLDMILGTLLIAADRQRQWAIISVGAALINPLLNWWLIRQTQATLQNGAVGAALVTLLTEVGIFVAYVWAQPRGLLGRPNLTFAGRVLLATAAMAAAIGLLLPVLQTVAPGGPEQRLGAAVVLLGAGVAGGIVFGGLALALRLVGPAEWRLVRRALRRGAV